MSFFQCDFYSNCLQKMTQVNVVFPARTAISQIGQQAVAAQDRPPVLYLLHGLSDDNTIWMRRTIIERYAEAKGLAVVMPDGGRSFYCNLPGGERYFDYISEELPALIEGAFQVDTTPQKRFIAGLSMGGFGTIKTALRCPGKFAAAVCFSGALDPSWLKQENPALYKADFQTDPAAAEEDVFGLLERYPEDAVKPRLFIACGEKDMRFFDVNRRFYEAAKAKGFEVVWDQGDYGHEWPFWDLEIQKAIPWMLQ